MRLGDGLRDREPEARAVALCVLSPIEAPEEPRLGRLRESGALIAPADDGRAVLAHRVDLHLPTPWRVLHRVVEQVEEQLRELVRVTADCREVGRRGEREGHAVLLRLWLERGARRRE